MLLFAILGGVLTAVIVAKLQTAPAEVDRESAQEKEREASEKLSLAETAKRQLQREALMERLERLRLSPHSTSWITGKCWSDQSWELVSQAAALGIDQNLKDQAAATLAGLDARLAKPFREMAASSVAFDQRGKLLLIGGAPAYHQYPAEAAKVWDSESKVVVHTSSLKEPGPVAFGRDRAPLQLLAREGPSMVLWNLAKQAPVSRFQFNPDSTRVARLALDIHQFPLLAMTPDGSFVAAAGIGADEKPIIAVWEGLSGKRLFQIPAQATAMAISADGKNLATGNNRGQITVWPITQEGELEYLQASRLPVQALAFSPDSQRLAVSEAGGQINIWKLGAKLPPTACFGSLDGAFALAFSPDGTLLASGGRAPAKLFDARSGHLLLQIGCDDFITGLAFTSDGRRLAVSSRSEVSPGGVSVWDLDYSRGIQILRGLAAPAAQICFSPDGRFLAALAPDWQVAIWNRQTGRLVRILQVPYPPPNLTPAWGGNIKGMAGAAFSSDGKRFVLSAGTQAKSWDVATGKELGAWELPDGALDLLAFHPAGRLLLFRMETKGDKRVCLVRALVEPKTIETVAEIKELDREIRDAKAPLDGSYIVVEASEKSTGENPGERPGRIEAFDPLTGRKLWPLPGMDQMPGSDPRVDPTGKVFAFRADKKIKLVEMPGGQLLESTATDLTALGPKGDLWVELRRQQTSVPQAGQSLFRRGELSPLLTFGIDGHLRADAIQFDVAGRHLAWANSDGVVSVCDLETVRKKLAEVGLAW